jgi:hypothetical protein
MSEANSMLPRHHVGVDFREKTFAVEVGHRFGFLVEAGFVALPVELPETTDRLPRSTSVRLHGPEARVEVCLALAFAGEDVVATRVETVKGRFDFGPTTAHKGHEMRKALDVQARRVADLLGIR